MVPKLIVTAALMVAQVALGAMRKIQGPRLEDLSVSLADYGSPIVRLWGKRKIQPQIIWAEELREEKVETKTKGGKYAEYKYYGTWASLICDHEIDAVSRVWFDKRLVYDITNKGPISLAILAAHGTQKLKDGGGMRVYLGTEDQIVNPRMAEWCEDRYGPDSCPAYRGSAYVLFKEIPLEHAGNRIPQVSIEAVNNPTPAYLYDQIDDSGEVGYTGGIAISPWGNWMVRYGPDAQTIEWWDVANRELIGFVETDDLSMVGIDNVAMAGDGTAYFFGQYTEGVTVYSALWEMSPLGVYAKTTSGASSAWFSGPTRVFDIGDVRWVLTGTHYTYATGYLEHGSLTEVPGQCARDFCVDADDNVWTLLEPPGSSNQFTLAKFTAFGLEDHVVTGVASARTHADMDAAFCHVDEFSHFFVVTDGKWYTIDDQTFAIKASGNFTGYTLNIPRGDPYKTSYWSRYNEYSLEDNSLIRTVDPLDWVNEDSGEFGGAPNLYDPVSDALIVHPSGADHVTWRYLNRIGSDGVTLADVVDDVSSWCGLTGQDTTELTQTVLGYSVTQGSGKDMIAPLLDIHDIDARPHDFSVQFKVRGSAPSGTILTEDFARGAPDDKGNMPPRYKVTIQQDTDLPRDVTINFADWEHDQQPNNVKSTRPVAATSSSRSDTIDLGSYADTADSAQQKADRFIRRIWNSRERVNLSLTAQKMALEPGDVTTISLDGTLRNVRLDKATLAGQQIDCEFVRDETSFAAVNTATTGPGMDGRDPEVILVPGLTKGFALDIPYVQDSDNELNPVIYFAAGGFNDPWTGSLIYRGDDGTYDDQYAVIDTSQEATWGYTTDALATANPWLWDRGNTLNVKLYNGTLTSSTEAEINADPTINQAAIGNPTTGYEIVNFTTATLQGDGSWDVSGFKRGRRGTEWARSLHEAGDEFILLDEALKDTLGTDEIGVDLSFKATTAGRPVDSALPIDLTFEANSLKPRAPVRVKGTKDASSGDWTLVWNRRPRIGGNWNGTTIPLGETTEEYEIDILNGSTVVRTIPATSKTATYTSAQQTTDFGSGQSSLSLRVYQLSATVGRGFSNLQSIS